ncbi:MAG: iron chelate uptake ABC transporter family permease subunit [Rickettsiales bacterium]
MRTTPTPTTIRTGNTMDELILRALTGGLLLAAMLGPLGSFVVWRRMAYFGDTIAHSALLGVAISLLSGGAIPMTLAIFAIAITIAIILCRYARDLRFNADTVLGILAHGALALGLVLVSLKRDMRVDINAFLFGDILAIEWNDIAILAALVFIVLATLKIHWRNLLMTTIDPAIAQVEGINVTRAQLVLTLLLAAVIAVAIKLTGILLITALLIIPAATARYWSKTPLQMAMLATVAGMVSIASGLFASIKMDVPTGPMMVVTAAALFVTCAILRRTR